MAVRVEEKSLGQLISDVSQNVVNLFRQELQLAQIEAGEKVWKAGRAIAWLVTGGFVLYMGVWALMTAVVLGLAIVLPAWAACLLVGLIISAVGALVLQHGAKKLQEIEPVPEKTVETMRENAQWIGQEIKRS